MSTGICFDLDGTLVRFQRPYGAMLREVLVAELGEVEDPDHLVEVADGAFYAAFRDLEPNPVEASMAAVLEAAGREGDPAAMAQRVLDAEKAATAVPEGTHGSLATLAGSHPLAVVTNGVPDWQRAKLAHHDLLGHFETVVASYEVGAHKPDPAPFEAVSERIDADEYVMVGDSYEADVEGARAAGFVPIHAENPDDGRTPDFWAALRAMVDDGS